MTSCPYIAVSPASLRAAVALQEARGGEWPKEIAAIDLALTVDDLTRPHSNVDWPTHEEWAHRWGWLTKDRTVKGVFKPGGEPSIKRVRRMLKDHGAWLDGHKAEAFCRAVGWDPSTIGSWLGRRPEGAAAGQSEGSARAAPGQPKGSAGTFEPDDPPNGGQPKGSARAAEGQRQGSDGSTRAENNHRPPSTVHRPLDHTHTSGGSERGGAAGPAPDGVCDLQTAPDDEEVPSSRSSEPIASPPWLLALAKRCRWGVEDTSRVVLAVVQAIRLEERPLETCGDAAGPIGDLVEAISPDSPDAFIADVQLVADACHHAPAFTFARLVRGEVLVRGDDRRPDNSRSVTLVLAVKHWRDRLDQAQAWREGQRQRPRVATSPNRDSDPPHAAEVDAVGRALEACDEAGGMPRPIGVALPGAFQLAEDVGRHEVLLAAVLWQGRQWRTWLERWRADRSDVVASWPLRPDAPERDLVEDLGPVGVARARGQDPVELAQQLGVPVHTSTDGLRVIEGGRA